MGSNESEEISMNDFALKFQWIKKFIKSSWIFILCISLIFCVLGFLYALFQKPVYVAESRFVIESDESSKIGSISGLASQFGLDLAGGSSVFAGENLIELFKSNLIIEKTLLSSVNFNGKEQILIDIYINSTGLRKSLDEKVGLKEIHFSKWPLESNRLRDSILKVITKGIQKRIVIEKKDKKLNFVDASFQSNDEFFSKVFLDKLLENGITYFIDYKTKKSRQNVEILQHQVDSVNGQLTGNIYKNAESNDLNINPLRQISRAPGLRKQVDIQVNGSVYAELLKNLELGKMTLRKEIPSIQMIDTPTLPLEKKKLGRLLGAILFGFIGFIISTGIAYIKFSNQKPN